MKYVKLQKRNNIDLILAVGGGSVCDYSKAVSVCAWCKEDPWNKYYLKMEDVDNKIIPVGGILTMSGTGSEMNGGAVITNHKTHLKIGHVFGENVFPKFSILNPVLTYTLSQYQMVAGFFHIMSHILELYFSDSDDYSCEIAVNEPENYEACSNIMWTATWTLNTLIAKGKQPTGGYKILTYDEVIQILKQNLN